MPALNSLQTAIVIPVVCVNYSASVTSLETVNSIDGLVLPWRLPMTFLPTSICDDKLILPSSI